MQIGTENLESTGATLAGVRQENKTDKGGNSSITVCSQTISPLCGRDDQQQAYLDLYYCSGLQDMDTASRRCTMFRSDD